MTMAVESYYDILGLSEDADDEQVKQAFRELAKHHHPDHNPGDANAEREFKRINTAYEGLKDASRRQAYNEWLAFSDRREKTKRTQWGRLAAMVFLLLLGPSAALYWVIVVGEIAVFDSAGDRPGALVSSSQERKPEAVPPAPKPEAAVTKSEPAPKREAALNPPAAPARPAPPAAQPAPAPAPQPPAAVVERAPVAPAPSVPSLSERAAAAKRAETYPGPDVTQALPQTPPKPAQLSDAEIARLEDESRNYDPTARGSARVDDEESNARAAARLLARLKEPDVAQPPARQPAAPTPVEPGKKRPLPADATADTFTDCPMCPMMSPTRKSGNAENAAGLAVSLSAITVAQWSACVSDGACTPYRAAARSGDDPVLDVSQREAGAYAAWLTGITGQPYRVVMPFSAQASRDCNNGGRRRNSNGFQWLEEGNESDCDPAASGGQNFESARGFRVARNVRPGG